VELHTIARSTPHLASEMNPARVRYYRVVPLSDGPGLQIEAVPRRGHVPARTRATTTSFIVLCGLLVAQEEGPERAEPLLRYGWEHRGDIRLDTDSVKQLFGVTFSVPLNSTLLHTDRWGVPMLATVYSQILGDLGRWPEAKTVLSEHETPPVVELLQLIRADLACGEHDKVLMRTDNFTSTETDLDAYLLLMRVQALESTVQIGAAYLLAAELLAVSGRFSPVIRHLIWYANAALLFERGEPVAALDLLDVLIGETTRWAQPMDLQRRIRESLGQVPGN
jgi:hypothetical protein